MTVPTGPNAQPVGPAPNGQLQGVNPLAYGGYSQGAQDWAGYYQGLGGAVQAQMAQQAQARQAADVAQGQGLYNNANSLAGAYAANVGNTGKTYAQTLYNAGMGLGGLYQKPATADFQEQNTARLYGNTGLSDLAAAASGNGPSAAQAQLGQGIGAAVRAQLAAGASARGGAMQQAAAQQEAGVNAAGIEAGAAGAAAQLRAQEVQHARDSLVQAANQQYASAGGMGLSALGGEANARLTGLGAAANTAMAGSTGAADVAMKGLGTGQQGLTAEQALGAQEGQGYTTLGLQGQQAYNQMAQGVTREELQANLQAQAEATQYTGQMQQLAQQQTNSIIGGVGSAAAAITPFLLASDETIKADVSPQGDASPGAAQGLPAATGTGDLMSAGRDADALRRDQLKSMLQGLRSASQSFLQQNYMTPGQAVAPKPLNPQPYPPSAMIGSSSNPIQAPPPAMSDERAKAAISPAPTADALLATLAKSKSTYSYKNPADQPVSPLHPKVPGARFAGVMAQDLQKVPEIGPGLVTDTPRGKMLEQQAGLSAALMGLGRVAERLQAIERTIGVKPKTGGLAAALAGAR